MPPKAKSTSHRKLDFESGMNRTKTSSRKSRAPPEPSSDSESFVSSDSELEEQLEMPAKDDSRRKKKAPPQPARPGRKDGRSRTIKGQEDDHSDLDDQKSKQTASAVAPHRQVLLAATYHIGIASIARPSVSSFIPSTFNYMSMVYWISSLLVDNTMVHELCPSFLTPVLYLYYGHVFYYHVLRARAAAGSDILTRLEKRTLTYYERVAPPESWPVAAPLLGFLEYFSAHKTEDPYYGWIVPKLPDLSQLGEKNALRNLTSVPGSSRVPLIPALQKFVRNFGESLTTFEDGILYPISQTSLDNDHQFCGLNASTATSASFQTLAFNQAWNTPLETGETFGAFDFDIKHARLRRWKVPDIPDTANLRTLPAFLGFTDDESFDWMKHLLATAEIANRFFPGSGNLSQVSPLTTLGMATTATYSRLQPRVAQDDVWYHERTALMFNFNGYSNTEQGLLDTKMSLTVSGNSRFSNNVIPAIANQSDPSRDGPFFTDDANRDVNQETRATPITEGYRQVDPARRFLELASSLYDNRAGR